MDATLFTALLLELLPPLLPDLLRSVATEIIEALVHPITSKLEKEVKELRGEVNHLKSKCEQLEAQDRRMNLRFRGIPEKDRETWAEAEQALRNALHHHGIRADMQMERVHRLGPKRAKGHRTMIAKFSFFQARDYVFSSKTQFKGSKIFVEEDFPATVNERRQALFKFALPISQERNVRFHLRYPFHDVKVGDKTYTLGQALDAAPQKPLKDTNSPGKSTSVEALPSQPRSPPPPPPSMRTVPMPTRPAVADSPKRPREEEENQNWLTKKGRKTIPAFQLQPQKRKSKPRSSSLGSQKKLQVTESGMQNIRKAMERVETSQKQDHLTPSPNSSTPGRGETPSSRKELPPNRNSRGASPFRFGATCDVRLDSGNPPPSQEGELFGDVIEMSQDN